ncbi:MAG: bifunctional metallophosphatase/5'-nucleotidase [Opitutales bacterium]
MTKHLLSTLAGASLLATTSLFGQQTIAVEDFDGGTPSWPNNIASLTFVDPTDSDQGLFIQTASSDNANFSGNSAFGRDLDGESGEPEVNPINFIFDPVNVSGLSNVTVSFDYAVSANADIGSYELIVDGVGQGAVEYYNDPDSGVESGTISVPVGTANTVALEITGTLNGGSDTLELDNFRITGDSSSPSIVVATTAASVEEGTTDADLLQVSLLNAGGETFPLTVTLNASPLGEVSIDGVTDSNTIQFTSAAQTIDVSVAGLDDSTFSGDRSLSVTATASGFFDGSASFDVAEDEVLPVSSAILLNEVRQESQTNDSNSNFVEFLGDPDSLADGYTLIVLSNEFNPGLVNDIFPLDGGVFDSDGVLLLANSGNPGLEALDLTDSFDFFGSPNTYVIVSGFGGTINVGDDLDTDDDGVLETTDWSSVEDSLAFIDGDGTTDVTYFSGAIVGPDGSFAPGGAAALPNGSDNYLELAFGDQSFDSPGELNSQSTGPITVTILHNNDGESSIFPDTDATLGTSPNDEFGGAATFVSLVDNEKAANTNPIMLSSGDNFLPGTVVDAGIAASVPFSPVVDYNALLINEIGYDALTIGNHEFDLGPNFLADFIGAVDNSVPFLSANLDFSAEPNLQALVDSGRIAKSTILVVDGQFVGVIGAITEGLAGISNEGNVVINAVEAAVEAEIAALQAQNVNKIILISHLQTINEELSLIQNISGVDVVIAGGGDEILDSGDTSNLLPSDTGNVSGAYPLVQQDENGDDVFVVTTPGNYRYLGRLVIDFDAAGNATVNGGTTSELVRNARVDGLTQDQDTLDNVITPVNDFIASAIVVAQSDVDLDTSRPNIRTIVTNMGAISADAFRWAANDEAQGLGLNDDYLIALTNGGGIRTDRLYPAGDVTDQQINNILPFDNEVNVITGMSTAQLLSVLEHSVGNVENVDGQWGHISGFTFTYDPTAQGQTTQETSSGSGVFEIATPGQRIVDVFMPDGTQVVDNGVITMAGQSASYSLVVNSFILNNGDRYPLGTISGDTYTPFTNQAVTGFGDFDSDGDTDYADVANVYLQSLSDTDIPNDGIANITEAQYAPSVVVNRVVALDAVDGADRDTDGINDAYEQIIIDAVGSDSVEGLADVDGTTDFDNDGSSDLAEFNAGTDATDASSTPSAVIPEPGFMGGLFGLLAMLLALRNRRA